MKRKMRILFVGLFSFILLTACVAHNSNDANSVPPTFNTATLSVLTPEKTPMAANSPILLPSSPIDKPVVLPTPKPGKGTVTGIITDQNGKPMQGLIIYLGIYDGVLIEISMQNSPRTITSNDGRFIFQNIPPSDPNMQYAIGIMIGADNGKIVNEPGTDHTLTFGVKAGDIVDLGKLKSDF